VYWLECESSNDESVADVSTSPMLKKWVWKRQMSLVYS
jgi:hypothetical protein